MKEVKDFVKRNSTEFVILRFQEEGKELTTNLKRFFVNRISELFGDMKIVKKDYDSWFRARSVKMGDIHKHNKNILILFRREIFEKYEFRSFNEGTKSYINSKLKQL